jgi:hypothetical protein
MISVNDKTSPGNYRPQSTNVLAVEMAPDMISSRSGAKGGMSVADSAKRRGAAANKRVILLIYQASIMRSRFTS